LGGKTGAMAQIMKNEGSILATDRSANKLDCLCQEMQRLGVTNVRTRQVDWVSPGPISIETRFDRILLDAPCSGLGVIRRNPDAKWRKSVRDIVRHGKTQFQLLCSLAAKVKTGGTLTYVVCSTEPEENETVVDRFLDTCKNFSVVTEHSGLSPTAGALVTDSGALSTRIHSSELDGFFAIKLKRMS
jgi:16S rRNA (cytosine967-C5)-methyltransferase